MPSILHIDTATGFASVAIGNAQQIITFRQSSDQMNHARFIHEAIKAVVEESCITLNDIDAVSVSNGPGSYTGLRVGLSTAKGLCYALDKPLILISTLEIMANAMIVEFKPRPEQNLLPFLYCPMIDARRMEVFTALYSQNLNELIPATPWVLDENGFSQYLESNYVVFSGSGTSKLESIIDNKNAIFYTLTNTITAQNTLAHHYFLLKRFADKAYSEPYYCKEFYDTRKNT